MSALQELGFTKDEVEQKVVARIADQLLSEYYEDGEGGDVRDTRLAQKFHQIIKTHVERQLNKLAEEYIVPHVKELIEGVAIQRTNEWGEKVGGSKTFVEYLTGQAKEYLECPVDYEGKPRSSYSKDTQTRLIHLIDKHLHYSVESAMKDAVDQVKKSLTPALQETCKLKLNEIAGSLKVSLK